MRLARNLAVIAVAGAVIAFLPGGGNAAEAVLAVISIAFAALIGLALVRLHHSQREFLWGLDARRRGALYAAAGVLVLCVAGADEAFDSDGGTLLWIIAAGVSIGAIVAVWRDAHRFA